MLGPIHSHPELHAASGPQVGHPWALALLQNQRRSVWLECSEQGDCKV